MRKYAIGFMQRPNKNFISFWNGRSKTSTMAPDPNRAQHLVSRPYPAQENKRLSAIFEFLHTFYRVPYSVVRLQHAQHAN